MTRLKMDMVFCCLGLALLFLGFGCASENNGSANKSTSQNVGEVKAPPAIPLPAGVTLKKDKDIQGVWLADGFDFKGYEAIYVSNTVFCAIERPNESEMRALAVYYVQMHEVEALRDSDLFKTVASITNDIPEGGKVLKLENIIIEFQKGGGGARYWAGEFGAGQPVIKVRGLLYDGDKLVFVYEAKRSGDSGMSRMFGGFMSDQNIQRDDIRDLAVDLATFMKRTAESK